MKTSSVQTPDGTLRFRRCFAGREPWAQVALLHGLGEHGGRWEAAGAFLAERGIRVSIVDLRGHGCSQGARGHADYDRLLDDVGFHLDLLGHEAPALPRFPYGHSMGGNLALAAVMRRPLRPQGVVVSGPALRPAFAPPAWKMRLGRLAARYWPTLRFGNAIDTSGLTRDPEVERRYLDDPLVHDRISAALGVAVLDGGEWLLEYAHRLAVPTLLMHGEDDPLTSLEATRVFARRAAACAEIEVWPGLRHEIHNEPEGEAVLARAVDWMRRAAAGPSAESAAGS